ncbi:MAG: hypothetical protein QOE33_584 [Acidobacteriota bacterium]|nr:hypothetical protein [Acidobacteriota bacterium]
MRHKFFSLNVLILALLCACSAARADIRVKQRMTFGGEGGSGGQSMETDEAIKGQRKRTEMQPAPGMKMITVTQCDLKRTLNISDMTRKYTVTPMGGVDTTEMSSGASSSPTGPGRVTRGGVVTYIRNVTDTGERKQMFGFNARHVKTRTSMETSADACEKTSMNIETDGWYIDLDTDFECLTNQAPQQRPMMSRPSGCQDRIVFRNTGAGRLGYALQETTRFLNKDGTVQTEITREVVSLSRETLAPALFDIPAGYTEARSQQELFDPMAMAKAMQQAHNEGGESGSNGSNAAETGGMSSVGSGGMSSSVGAKQPGMIRVGVVRIGNKTTQSVDAGTLRATLIAAITESGVEAIPLTETAPDAAQAEAKQKDCDYVLFTDVSGLKQSAANKIGGFMGRAAGVGGATDRFESKLDYTLTPVAGGAPVQANATAKEDGGADASVNSALRKEAQAVVARVRK